MLKYHAAIIGLGKIAWRYDSQLISSIDSRTHARTYVLSDRAALSGGCSINPEDREAFKQVYQVPVYSDPVRMIEEVRPDIVSICSPTEYHFEHTIAAMEAGIPMIWLEKPPVSTLRQLDFLINRQAESRSKPKILVGYQRRYTPIFKRLKDILQKDTLGQLHSIHVNYSRGLMNNGSHYIDLLFFLLGDSLEPKLLFTSDNGGFENPTFGLLFPDGPSVFFSGLDVPYHCMDLSVTCEGGRASILYGGIESLWEEKVEQDLYPGNFRLKEGCSNPLGRGDSSGVMMEELNDLIDAYENDTDPISNLYTARNTLQLLESVWWHMGRMG